MPPARGMGVKCGFVRDEGSQCGAWARRDTIDSDEGPRCVLHQGDAAARSARARRAALASSQKRHANIRPLEQAELVTPLSLGDLYKVVSEALVATTELGTPDHSARLAAVAVIVLAAPRHYRQTPEDVRELLRRFLPKETALDPDRINVEETFRRLRAEWWSLPRWHPVRGLVARDLPRRFVLPWEDYTDVVKAEAPRDVPPAQADVLHLPDGQVALRRPGEVLRVLESVEDDGGLVRAVVNLR